MDEKSFVVGPEFLGPFKDISNNNVLLCSCDNTKNVEEFFGVKKQIHEEYELADYEWKMHGCKNCLCWMYASCEITHKIAMIHYCHMTNKADDQ